MSTNIGAISLPQTSRFDEIVRSSATNLIAGVKDGVAKRLGRFQIGAMHQVVVPEVLEAEVVAFQRDLLKGLKKIGALDSSKKIIEAPDLKAASSDLQKIFIQIEEVLQTPTVKASYESLKGKANLFKDKQGKLPEGLIEAINNIRAPEITLLNIDPITVGAISGACAGAVGAAITWAMSPPPPPPPPPPPASGK